jgi:hypothetical protein
VVIINRYQLTPRASEQTKEKAMNKFFVIFAIVMFLVGCSESVDVAETVLYQWNTQNNEWHPTENKGRDILILKGARAASQSFVAENLEAFESDDLNREKYLLITFDAELLIDNTVVFSQKGLTSGSETEVKIQKENNETWGAFYKRGFRDLAAKEPGEEEDSPPPVIIRKPPDLKQVVTVAPSEGSPEAVSEESLEAPNALTPLPIYFNWEPGNSKESAFQYHPYVVENLDRTILLAASNLGIETRKLLKLDVDDFNSINAMIILTYAPEGLNDQIVRFTIRIENKVISTEIRRKKKEDWLEFYTRGLCSIGKKAKLLDCRVRYH